MPATLVVVDMQPVFSASRDAKVLVEVTKAILEAKAARAAIIFVEYSRSGQTHSALIDLVKGYRHKTRIIKHADDGSFEVVRALRRRNFHEMNLRVCGVNTHACVWATVQGLLNKLPHAQIEVIKKACNWNKDKRYDWRTYLRHPNLRLV